MGRGRSAIWEYFIHGDVETRSGRVRTIARCNFCGHDVASQPERMRKHLQKCESTPLEAKSKAQTLPPASSTVGLASSPNFPSGKRKVNGVDGNDYPKRMKKYETEPNKLLSPSRKKDGMEEAVDTATNAFFHERADESFVKMCISGNLSWSTLDNKFFIEGVGALRPSYYPPSSVVAQRKIVPELVQKMATESATFLQQSSNLTLILQATTAASSTNWIVVDNTGGSAVVRSQQPTDCQEATSVLLTVMAELQTQTSASISVCCESTDVFRKLKQSESFSEMDVPHIGACMGTQTAHIFGDLLSCCPQVSLLLSSCLELVNFLDHSSDFQQILGTTPLRFKKPYLSSWHVFMANLKYMLSLESAIRNAMVPFATDPTLLSQSDFIPPTIKTLLNDDNLWDHWRHLDHLLQPLTFTHLLSECNHTSAAQFLVTWFWLHATASNSPLLDASQRQTFRMKFQGRIRKYVTPLQFSSFLVDLKVRNTGLSEVGQRCVKKMFAKECLRMHARGVKSENGPTYLHVFEEVDLFDRKQSPYEDQDEFIQNSAIFWKHLKDRVIAACALIAVEYVCVSSDCNQYWHSLLSSCASPTISSHNVPSPPTTVFADAYQKLKIHLTRQTTPKLSIAEAKTKYDGLVEETSAFPSLLDPSSKPNDYRQSELVGEQGQVQETLETLIRKSVEQGGNVIQTLLEKSRDDWTGMEDLNEFTLDWLDKSDDAEDKWRKCAAGFLNLGPTNDLDATHCV